MSLRQILDCDPENAPLARPGVYRIVNKIDGKQYIGISANILARFLSHRRGGSPTKLSSAILKHGAGNFVFEPIFYLTAGETSCLPVIESQLIHENATVGKRGYNICSSHGTVGPYGEEFMRTMNSDEVKRRISDGTRAALQRPDVKHSLRCAIDRLSRDPAFVVTRNARLAKYGQDRSIQLKRAATLRKTLSTPEHREKMSLAASASQAAPDYRERMSVALRGLVWITDGHSSRKIPANDPIPEGWRSGRNRSYVTDAYRSRMSDAVSRAKAHG